MPEVRLIDANAFLENVLPECKYPDALKNAVENQPTIEAEPVRQGRWIQTTLKGYYECSACGYEHTSNPDQRFCSYCGAKMYQTGGTISKERFAEIMRGDDNG